MSTWTTHSVILAPCMMKYLSGHREKLISSGFLSLVSTPNMTSESEQKTLLLYSSETWTLYKYHVKVFEHFHQRCLRHGLSVGWTLNIPDTQVLKKAGILSIETNVYKHWLCWTGHLGRIKESKIPKQMLPGELVSGK